MPVTVLVTFYSRGGTTEQLAQAAAVGAVQARAAIRLRRVADVDPQTAPGRVPEATESLRRMHKEYVAPREADVLAADALIVGSPADLDASAAEWASYLDLLAALQADGRLAGKVAAAIGRGRAIESFSEVLRRLGLTIVPSDAPADDVSGAVALGRKVAAIAAATREP
jgi:multimeric flavodoxin WrbA